MNEITVLKTACQVEKTVGQWRNAGMKVGFVPTMGALHRGHLSLVSLAMEKADRVLVSIFVNPSQFGRGEDLDSYPRTFDDDLVRLNDAGAHCVFFPSAEEIYPQEFSTNVSVGGLTEALCGKYRPGHFDGVTTVWAVLFGIVRPDIAVFGRKDAQQLAVVRRMASDLRLGIKILSGDTVREPDGLAMSSRNAYLSSEEREQASVISRGLLKASEMVSQGERDSKRICDEVRKVVSAASMVSIQYLELVDPDSMKPVKTLSAPGLLAIAVYFGHTRLIDNVILKP